MPGYVLESLRFRAAPAGAGTGQCPDATAVVDLEDGGKVVCACDAAAAAAGVGPGMALNSALALLPGLHVLARDVVAERTLLEAVAARAAAGFTPRVALDPPDGVLLEVRGSLRLFGGVRRLVALLREQLQSMGVEPRLALAPTPLASLWFARSGEEVALRDRDGLASRLAPLPLACARWPGKSVDALATMGVRAIGDCLRLPRDGFARRFGPELLRSLDRALGRAPDPRAAFASQERFVARRDLEPEIADTERLGRAIVPLLDELCRCLQARARGVAAIELRLMHRDTPATRVLLRFAEPVSRVERMAGLLRERLARIELPAPVRAVRVRSGPPVEVSGEDGDLFARDRRVATGVPQLVERLRARLGADAVQGLHLVPEHRPEYAWKNGDIHHFRALENGECPHFSHSRRPLWLLAQPQAIEGDEWPRHEGRLEIEEGPERIESGWWDGRDVQRDYYVARGLTGVRLWVFRDRRRRGDGAGGWFLHGVFG